MEWHSHVSFHLVVTETPCGDASIYGSAATGTTTGNQEPSQKRKKGQIFKETGGKPVEFSASDNSTTANAAAIDKQSNFDRHHVGKLRTKSARSDTKLANRTTSMSCSDKLALWNCVGFQGALLSHWVKPAKFATVILALGDEKHGLTSETADIGLLRHAARHSTIRALSRGTPPSSLDSPSSRTVPPTVIVDTIYSFKHGRHVVKSRVEAGCSLLDQNGKDNKRPKFGACGTSLVWLHKTGVPVLSVLSSTKHNQPPKIDERTIKKVGRIEVLIGIYGLKQGARKRKRSQPTNPKLVLLLFFQGYVRRIVKRKVPFCCV